MLNRYSNYLEKFKIINNSQHGFRSGQSTNTALLELYERVIQHMNAGESPVGVFCDLSRAFDCVDHHMLLQRLFSYGVRGNVLDWFRSYLSGRSQFVEVKHKDGSFIRTYRSSTNTVANGVPQGSILGPVLFITYVNGVFSAPGASGLVFYADDASLVLGGRTVQLEQHLNCALRAVHSWFCQNRLALNASKTHYVQFHTRQNTLNYPLCLKVGDMRLERTREIKFLGVVISDVFDWSTHVRSLVGKLNTICFQVRNLKTVLDRHALLIFYHAQVSPRIGYGILLWGSSSLLGDVFVSQKRIIRCIASISLPQSCRSVFKDMRVMTVPCTYLYELLKHAYRIKHRYILNHSRHTHNTREVSICLPCPRLDIVKQAPDYAGPRLFNMLPRFLKGIDDFRAFKVAIKNILLENAFYSVGEFVEHMQSK